MESADIEFSPQVLRAIELAQKIFSSPTAVISLFREFSDFIVTPSLSNDELYAAAQRAFIDKGVDVIVDQLYYIRDPHNSAFMQCEPFAPGRPTIVFDCFLCSGNFGLRQLYFHLIKIIHEYTYLLIQEILRLNDAKSKNSDLNPEATFTTPAKCGPITERKGDAGSGWEEIKLGGRVFLNSVNLKRPFQSQLILKTRPFPEYPPDMKLNTDLYWISDQFIANFIEALSNWKEDAPLPNFLIDERSRELKYKCERLGPKKKGKKRQGSSTTNKRKLSRKVEEGGDEEEVVESESLENSLNELENSVILGGMSREQIEFSEKTGIKF